MKKYTAIDLFAGCGGLSLGLENAGFESVYVNELNNDALESYLINREKKNPYLRERFNSNDVKTMISDKKYLKNLVKDFKSTYNLDVNSGDSNIVGWRTTLPRLFRHRSQKNLFS